MRQEATQRVPWDRHLEMWSVRDELWRLHTGRVSRDDVSCDHSARDTRILYSRSVVSYRLIEVSYELALVNNRR